MKTVRYLVPVFVPLFLLSIYLVIFISPGIATLGTAGKIIYFHVPSAWVGSLAFVTGGFAAAFYLKTRRDSFAAAMHRAAVIGVIFMGMATLSGSIWARLAWGSFWNWDVRETSMVLLLLIYAAYFALRSFSRGTRSLTVGAAYLVYAAMLMPLFVFVIPRLYPTLHPETIINREGRINLEPIMRVILLVSLAAWTILFIILMKLKKTAAQDGVTHRKNTGRRTKKNT